MIDKIVVTVYRDVIKSYDPDFRTIPKLSLPGSFKEFIYIFHADNSYQKNNNILTYFRVLSDARMAGDLNIISVSKQIIRKQKLTTHKGSHALTIPVHWNRQKPTKRLTGGQSQKRYFYTSAVPSRKMFFVKFVRAKTCNDAAHFRHVCPGDI